MKKTLSIVAVITCCYNECAERKGLGWLGTPHHHLHYAEKHLTEEANEKCRHYLNQRLPHYSSWQDYWRHSDPFKETSYLALELC